MQNRVHQPNSIICHACHAECGPASQTAGQPKPSFGLKHHASTARMEVLTRVEWILASTGDAGPTFNRHWVGVGLYSPLAVCTARHTRQKTRGVEPVLF